MRDAGTEGLRLAGDHLFGTAVVHGVEASADMATSAEQRAPGTANVTREGTNRRARFRDGAAHDQVIYARLRSDSD